MLYNVVIWCIIKTKVFNMDQQNYKMEVAFDVIPLPTKGVFYKNKKDTLKVSFLTASDENILTSQNLIQQGLVIDELLKVKVLDDDITVEELHDSDKEAVLLFLRNTAYGSIIKLSVVDPDTGSSVEVEYDLQNIKYKEFTLTSDSEGLFDYILPTSKKVIKFKFLSPNDEKELEKINEVYKDMLVKPTVTKRLEKMIISVDGEKDPMKISHFISTIPIKDSQSFRKYVTDNTPGLDKGVEITLPSEKKIQTFFNLDTEFFRPFYGL